MKGLAGAIEAQSLRVLAEMAVCPSCRQGANTHADALLHARRHGNLGAPKAGPCLCGIPGCLVWHDGNGNSNLEANR